MVSAGIRATAHEALNMAARLCALRFATRTRPSFIAFVQMQEKDMATEITQSDDFAFGAEAADVGAIDGYEPPELIAWDADPAEILAAREEEFGVNCFDQPIN